MPSSDDGLYIIAPGLLDARGIDCKTLKATPQALADLVARADAAPFNATHLISCVAGLMPELPRGCLQATAALRYVDDTGHPPPGYCLAADPVHLEVGREQIIMGRHLGMNIASNESKSLQALLEADITRHGTRLEITRPDHWYLHLDQTPDARFATGEGLDGRGIRDHMPSGTDAGPWRTLISDAQILLHDCSVNKARAAQGKATINSLWLWGGGSLPSDINVWRYWTSVASDDPVVRGLARLTGCPDVSPLPPNLETCALKWAGNGPTLIVINSAANHLLPPDPEAWRQGLFTLDEHWFQPALQALSDKRLKQLTLIPFNGQRYRLTRALLRRWWKRKRPLEHFLNRDI